MEVLREEKRFMVYSFVWAVLGFSVLVRTIALDACQSNDGYLLHARKENKTKSGSFPPQIVRVIVSMPLGNQSICIYTLSFRMEIKTSF